MLKELHNLECENIKLTGAKSTGLKDYEFKTVAFHAVLANPDRKVLAKYEDYYQKLAIIEHDLDAEQLSNFKKAVEIEYSGGCDQSKVK